MELGRLKYDILFKKIFQKKHILKAFLNTVLEQELPAPIQEVSFEPTDFIIQGTSRLIQGTKHDVIDVFCLTERNERILVELQKGADKRALGRFLDYQCRNYSSQFTTGADYAQILPCYSICWFFDLKPPHTRIKETITLRSDCTQTDWIFAWEMIALYPKNIPKKHIKQQTLDKLEEWLILDVTEELQDATHLQQLIHTPEVSEAFETLDLSELSEEQIRKILFEEHITQQYPDLYQEKVLHEKHQEKMDIAQNLLAQHIDVEVICLSTGLTKEEIEHLKEAT